MNKTLRGFTIVELLVVIVVISILTTLSVVGFARYHADARDSERSSKMTVLAEALEKYYDENGEYPSCPTLSGTAADITTNILPGIDPQILLTPTNTLSGNSIKCTDLTGAEGEDDVYAYTGDGSVDCISGLACVGWILKYKEENSNVVKHVNSRRNTPTPLVCATGFIAVPGSVTYGTGDFCVMKYEAKMASATVPISEAAGLPWISITQTAAASYSQNIVGCSGCHLITESQYLTIAQNVLQVASNWSGGAVGNGYIYRGNSDSSSGNVIAADANDANGYTGTGNTSPSIQRRTLTLSNGEVIWDIGGNATEWTDGTAVDSQPGIAGETGFTYSNKEWTTITAPGTLVPDPSPTATSIPNASTWTTANGIGALYSNSNTVGLRSFLHGGNWNSGGAAGVLMLQLNYGPGSSSSNIGFRAAQ